MSVDGHLDGMAVEILEHVDPLVCGQDGLQQHMTVSGRDGLTSPGSLSLLHS